MPLKRVNPRLAKRNRAFSVVELADLLDVHKRTVRNWLADGLPTVDDTRPTLIHGDEFQEWWAGQVKAAKRPLKPGQFYCCKCRQPKTPAGGMVEYAATNAATVNLKALCETCETMMQRRARLDSIAALMPDLDVRRTGADSSIGARATPSVNCTDERGD
ncbi:MAG: helix-turn-helix domain-containing protein [Pseudomonadota bacterium]